MKAYEYLIKHKDTVVCKFISPYTPERILYLIKSGDLDMMVINEINLGDKSYKGYTLEEVGQKDG